jgi:tetratricopeptide (TPR) repeat protein
MSPSRIEMLLGFLRQKPGDPFPRYALALEYKNGGRLEDARTEFDTLLRDHVDYTAGYLHAGNLYVALGLRREAAAIYRRGIDACVRRGDAHARGELEGALAALPDARDP